MNITLQEVLETSKQNLIENGKLQPTILALKPGGEKIFYALNFSNSVEKGNALNCVRIYTCADQIEEYFVSMEAWVRFADLKKNGLADIDGNVCDHPNKQEAIAVSHVQRDVGKFKKEGISQIFTKQGDQFTFGQIVSHSSEKGTLQGNFYNLITLMPQSVEQVLTAQALIQDPRFKDLCKNVHRITS